MYALVLGTIADGVQFVGPFPSAPDAIDYADNNCRHTDWLVVYVNEPEQEA